jgi:hypothetical protein
MLLVELVIEKVKLQDFIEDLTSLELTLAYIQMDFYLKYTLLLMMFRQQQVLEEKYLKVGILI